MSASRGWQRIISRTAAVATGLAIKLHLWRVGEPIPALIGTPPSQWSMWHDPVEHARDFAERYAEPMNYHVENRLMEARHPDRPAWRAEVRLPAPRLLAGGDDRRRQRPETDPKRGRS